MTLRTSITPLGSNKNQNQTAYKNPLKMRNMRVSGDSIILRDYVSCYYIDLSDKKGGQYSFTLDTSQIHQQNHEVLNFELLVIMPGNDAPTVNLPFVDRWLDFGLWCRFEAGKAYVISCIRLNGVIYGSLVGSFSLPTYRNILGKTKAVESDIVLDDGIITYRTDVNTDTEITFNADSLKTNKDVLRFDLLLSVKTDRPTITFPVVRWVDFGYPFVPYESGYTYVFTFFSFDGGNNWLGKYNTRY